MKKYLLFLLSLTLVMFSCEEEVDSIKDLEKPPIDEVVDAIFTLEETEVDLPNEGGSKSISFESNISWTVSSSENWCEISPTSGEEGSTNIIVTVPANEDYDDRSCTITFKGGGITKTVTVNQGENLGLLVSKDKYELTNEESTIDVEVKANVEFEVEISEDWITQVEARGLTSTQLQFVIAKNDTYGNREGTITIKQKDGDLSSTITVYQSQEDAIIISDKDLELSSENQTVEVEVKTNVDFEVIIPEDAKGWVKYTQIRALRTETVLLEITENKDYDARTAEIYIKNKETTLQDTLTITQAANVGLLVSKDKYELTNEESTIDVEVKANVEFEVEISEDWITQVETRGLTSTQLQFVIAKNDTYGNRESTITIKQKDGDLSSTVTVYQSQEDAIIISDKDLELSSENQTVEVEVKTNVDFEVIIPEDAKDWVKYTQTRALRTETVLLEITENKDYDARTTEVYIKNKETTLQDTLTITQAAMVGLLVSKDKYELTHEEGGIDVEVKANVNFEVIITDDWITQVETRGLATTNLHFLISKNDTFEDREGTITIKQTDGDLSGIITVYQSKEDVIIISDKDLELSSEIQTVEVELQTNIDFEVIIPTAAQDWVSYAATRGLRTEILLFRISENEESESRSTEIYVKNRETTLQDTLTINQQGKSSYEEYVVEEVGSLSTIINETQKDTITAMTLKGELNAADFEVLKNEMPNLRHLDLSDVKCEGDKIPDYAFGGSSDFGVYTRSSFSNNLGTIQESQHNVGSSANVNITTVVLPKSITAIGKYAFANCIGLQGDLIIPEGVTKIEYGAFDGCYNFEGNLTLPQSLTTIGQSAFRWTGFTGILNLPKNLTAIGEWAFSGNRFSGDLIIPKGVTKIEDGVFDECMNLTSLTLHDDITEIGEVAFGFCQGFTGTLNLPKKMTEIRGYSFYGCSGFTGDLIIPSGVVSVGEAAFAGCAGFDGSLELPESLEVIGRRAFETCSGLTGTLTIPKNVRKIEDVSFAECVGFNKLNLDEGLALDTIQSAAFWGCSGFKGTLSIPENITIVDDMIFMNCSGFDGLIIHENVTAIGSSAFQGCTGLVGELKLPDGLTTLGGSAFEGCSGFTGVLKIPRGIIELGDQFFGRQMFKDCTGLTSVEFHSQMTFITGFEGCTGLTGTLVIPDLVTETGFYAFQGCTGLTGLKLGRALKRIHQAGFKNCTGLSGEIVFPEYFIATEKEAFWGCDNVEYFKFIGSFRYRDNMLPSGATIKVPEQYHEHFSRSAGWKDHKLVTYKIDLPAN